MAGAKWRASGRRGGRGGGKQRGHRDDPSNGNGHHSRYTSNVDIVKEHEELERYYNAIIPLEDEQKKAFWDALKRQLPNSFRFCGSRSHALSVKRLLEERYIPDIVKIERLDGQLVEAPQPVSWYPDQLAYSMTTPKNIIRKFPPFAAFQKFLVSETCVGHISRQEVVSMIPPLLMDLRPGMTVLDLCAAPGSKAAQLLEMIHVGEEDRLRKFTGAVGETKSDDMAEHGIDSGDDGRATGLLIANDFDYKRSHMLVHQLKRLSSPNLLVTNHDATMYPSIRLPNGGEASRPSHYLKFDRILADVPCSGDGTLRKNVNLWVDWQPGNAIGLHLTQTRILVRALAMLKVGGRVVYSTCSMNPIENEAVVVSAIERCGGPAKVGIVDCSDRLPGLQRASGMHQWQVMDKTGRIWTSWQEVQQYALTENEGEIPGKVAQTMFPRGDESDCSGLALNRCMRVYAHQQDTGGFFIAVLEKTGEIKARPENPPAIGSKASEGEPTALPKEEAAAKIAMEESKAAQGAPTDVLPSTGVKRPRVDSGDKEGKAEVKKMKTEPVPDDTVPGAPPTPEPVQPKTEAEIKLELKVDNPPAQVPTASQPPRRNAFGAYEEPFKFLPSDHEVIKNIQSFYQLSPRFPSDRYMVRNATGEPVKAMYYTSALVRDILVENEGRGVKFVHGGVKMFVKQDAPSAEVCRWRIQSEGMHIIEGYVGPERVIRLTKKDTFRKLLEVMFPKLGDGEWSKLDEIGERVRDVGMGCCVLRVEPDGSDPDFAERMVLPLWKSFASMNLMLPKEDRAAMLLRIYNDTTPVINETLKETAAKKAEAERAEAEEAVAEEAEAENDAADARMDIDGDEVAVNAVKVDSGLSASELQRRGNGPAE